MTVKIVDPQLQPLVRRGNSPVSIYRARLLRQRAAAAQAALKDTATTPFYWEVGDATGPLGWGSVRTPTLDVNSTVSFASASKWMFGAYALEKLGSVTAAQRKLLNMSSGYMMMTSRCLQTETVDQCAVRTNANTYNATWDGTFFYESGHFQHFADTDLGLGGKPNGGLSLEYQNVLGLTDVHFSQPLLAGGMFGTPLLYRSLLLKLLNNQLVLSPLLGQDKIPASGALGVAHSPAPSNERWYYSYGHWVEFDGTCSSGGAWGFYPWISADKTLYGMVVHNDDPGTSQDDVDLVSVYTGRLIRNAWIKAA